jgi:hypothetical protein
MRRIGFSAFFVRAVFFDVGTRCIPIGCEGPILRSGISGTEVVGYLFCIPPSALFSPFIFLKPPLGLVGEVLGITIFS